MCKWAWVELESVKHSDRLNSTLMVSASPSDGLLRLKVFVFRLGSCITFQDIPLNHAIDTSIPFDHSLIFFPSNAKTEKVQKLP